MDEPPENPPADVVVLYAYPEPPEPAPPDPEPAPPDPAPPEAAPWAIKSISTVAREMAVAAAKRRRLTVGEFVDIAIRREIAAERAAIDAVEAVSHGEIMPPAGQGAALVPLSGQAATNALDMLSEAVGVAERLAGLRFNGRPPRRVIRLIENRMMEILSDPR